MKISPHKSGGFYTTLTIKGNKKFIYGSTPEDVEIKYTEMKYKYYQGYDVNNNPTLEEYMIIWYNTFKKDEGALKTQEMYRNCVNNHINPVLGKKKVKEITATQIQALVKSITSSKSLAHKVRITLNQIFKQAIADHIISFNPVSGSKVIAPDKPKRKCLTPTQRELLLKILKCHRTYPIIFTTLYTGMRMGETLALLLNDIDFDAKVIRVTKATEYAHSKPQLKAPKTENGFREIPMPDILSNYLKSYLKRRKNKKLYVFPGHAGGPMGLTEIKSQWRKAQKIIKKWFESEDNSNMKEHEFDLTFRLLRHTYCTGLYDAGIDELVAAEIMGHDVSIMREVYTHIQGKRKKRNIVRLDNIYKDETKIDEEKTN